jgi:hypothetical protein
MGTSYIEYKGFGFWSRDNFIESWIATLIDEIRMSTAPELWQDVLIQNWEAQVQIDGGSISLDLDELLSDEMRRDRVRHLAEQAVNRATGSARRTGELFVALLAGNLRTDASSPINYL